MCPKQNKWYLKNEINFHNEIKNGMLPGCNTMGWPVNIVQPLSITVSANFFEYAQYQHRQMSMDLSNSAGHSYLVVRMHFKHNMRNNMIRWPIVLFSLIFHLSDEEKIHLHYGFIELYRYLCILCLADKMDIAHLYMRDRNQPHLDFSNGKCLLISIVQKALVISTWKSSETTISFKAVE